MPFLRLKRKNRVYGLEIWHNKLKFPAELLELTEMQQNKSSSRHSKLMSLLCPQYLYRNSLSAYYTFPLSNSDLWKEV